MIQKLFILAAARINDSDVNNLPKPELTSGTLSKTLQLVFGVAGAIALLVIVVAAFRYVVSTGNPEVAGRAKNTIIYALIGLLVAAGAYGIVTFVLQRI